MIEFIQKFKLHKIIQVRETQEPELKLNENLYIVIIKGDVSSLGNFQIRNVLEDCGTIMQSKK